MLSLYLSSRGRIDRTGFIAGLGGVLLFALLLDLALAALPGVNEALILSGVWALLAWPAVCLLIKRFRDTGSGPGGLWLFAPQIFVALAALAMSGAWPDALLTGFTWLGVAANLLCWGALVWLAAAPSRRHKSAL